MNRAELISKLESETFDVLIIGGGITGAGILQEAVSRGYKAILIEKNDFSSGTSSRSSKLIHGGLRYLQYGEFSLVREAISERTELFKRYPHRVKPLPFLFPMYHGNRLKYKLGMMLYQFFNKDRSIPKYRFLSKSASLKAFPFLTLEGFNGSFIYYDGVTNDALFTNEIILEAQLNGGFALNYIEFESSDGDGYVCFDRMAKQTYRINTKTIINATGVWNHETSKRIGHDSLNVCAPSTGIHLVFLQKDFPLVNAVFFPSGKGDGRLIFAIPWEWDMVLLGTTDVAFGGNPDELIVSRDEVIYLLEAIQTFAPELQLLDTHIQSAYVGLRPLYYAKDRSTKDQSRDYEIWWESDSVLSILGGKLTSFRSMAKKCVDQLLKTYKPSGVAKPFSTEPQKNVFTSTYGLFSSLLETKPHLLEQVHFAYPITKSEVLFMLNYLQTITLEDLLFRRFSIGYCLAKHENKSDILNAFALEMKAFYLWDETTVLEQIRNVEERLKTMCNYSIT